MQTYVAAILLILASLALGRAICAALGGRGEWWAYPAVGFGALIVLAGSAVKLPGGATTAAIVCLLAVLAAIGFLVVRRLSPAGPADLLVAGLALVGASLPFVSAGRIGVLGAGIDNDMAVHLPWAEALRSPRVAHLWNVINASPQGTYNGYPLGPHSVVATLGTLTGFGLDAVFTGLMMTIIVLMAVVAANVLAGQSLWRRVVVALACALTYLVAAFYGEGAFKETIMALLLLAFALHLEQVSDRWPQARGAMRWRLVTPAILLIAGGVYNYSYLALSWFVATVGLWIVVEVVRRPTVLSRWTSRERLLDALMWIAVSAAIGIVLLLPVAGQAIAFFNSYGVSPAAGGAIAVSNLGNLSGPLSPYQAFGIWLSRDFRHAPGNAFHAGELAAFALALVVYGLVRAVRSRQFVIPCAAAASGLIWWYSERTQSPYVGAKALVIASPLFIALILRGLLVPLQARTWQARLVPLAAAVAFCFFAGYSSLLSLRNEPLQAPEAGRELATFHRTIGNDHVLFLGVDDFAPWQLREAAVTTLSPPTSTQGGALWRPTKPFVDGQSLDFDSVLPADLDNFRYVITSSGSYASNAPSNFTPISTKRLYTLWLRNGPTVSRQAPDPTGAPGAILNCRAAGLLGKRGEAGVMAQPLVLPGVVLAPGHSAVIRFGLPPGSWDLSAQYFSYVDIGFSAQGQRWSMPAYVGRRGPWFRLGPVVGAGITHPVSLRVRAERPTFLTGSNLTAVVTGVAATALPDLDRVVALRQACGHYVDWYRVS